MEFGRHDSGAPRSQAWSSQSENTPTTADAEMGADLDEPPDRRPSLTTSDFHKTSVRKPNPHSSLLTKALQHPSDDEDVGDFRLRMYRVRRRSVTSNISLASTADLTSDTGLTSPSRTNTPSPPLPEIQSLRFGLAPIGKEPVEIVATPKPEVTVEAPRKRCISFACGKPNAKAAEATIPRPQPMIKVPSAQETPRRSCIKFACPASRPASTQNTPPSVRLPTEATVKANPTQREMVSSPDRKPRSARPQFLRRNSREKRQSKTVNLDQTDLEDDSAQFHEFACEMIREDDWIRHERQKSTTITQKLTINDTLIKENHFRQIAREAEEEAEAEEDEDEVEAGDDDEEDEDDEDDAESDDNDDEEEIDEDDDSEFGTEEGDDGYHTDEETGFADSDEDEDDDLILWTPSQKPDLQPVATVPASRRSSICDHSQSDSSTSHSSRAATRGKARRVPIRPITPELPDSTDFVCGTLDEDRPMEEAYLSCIAARKAQKLHIIPQDIDPSFPASDPEDEEAEERFNPVHRDSDEELWLHGEMEDLHHDAERHGRRKSRTGHSPKRLHSPAPIKIRGRSPRPGQTSPRRLRSPPPKALTSSRASPAAPVIHFGLGTHVGLTQTKSLPRPPAMFRLPKQGKKTKVITAPRHVRGAIDIVKGLESKRQRRKEKFYQKYCNRARKGQIPERKPLPGQGAVRMKELGLLMAGKSNNRVDYVMSV